MNDSDHLPPEDVLRRAGLEIQAEYRMAGIELPPDLTPEDLARAVFDDLRATLEHERAAYLRMHAEVMAELGPTATGEEVHRLLDIRMDEWRRNNPRGEGPAASA